MIRVFFATFVFIFAANTAFSATLSVNGENVNLRTGPGTDFPVKWEYGKGFPLQIVERKGDWVKVTDFEKDSGWIHESFLAKKTHTVVNVYKDTKKKINIRRGPTTNDEVVGKAYYGVVFEVLETKSDWVKVRHDSGLEGWINKTLLWGM